MKSYAHRAEVLTKCQSSQILQGLLSSRNGDTFLTAAQKKKTAPNAPFSVISNIVNLDRASLSTRQSIMAEQKRKSQSGNKKKNLSSQKSSLKTSKSVLKFGNTSLLYQSSHKYTAKKDVKDKAYFLRKEAKMNENSSPCFQISSPNVYS